MLKIYLLFRLQHEAEQHEHPQQLYFYRWVRGNNMSIIQNPRISTNVWNDWLKENSLQC